MKKMLILALIVSVLLVIGCSGSTEPEDAGTGSNAPTNLVGNYNWNVSVDVICSVDLTWDAPEEPDNDNFEYRVYKNDQLLTTLTIMQNYYTDIDCIPGGDYNYYITVYYSSGESEPSNIVNVLFDMQEILIGSWHDDDGGGYWWERITFNANGDYSHDYNYPPGWTEHGTYTVQHDTLFTTIDGNGPVFFSTYDSMYFNNKEWDR
jgi:hypothetical protein